MLPVSVAQVWGIWLQRWFRGAVWARRNGLRAASVWGALDASYNALRRLTD